VSNAYATGDISATTSSDDKAFAGGIAGSFDAVIYAYSTGAVSATGTGTGTYGSLGEDSESEIRAGGIVGCASHNPVRYTVALNSSISASESNTNTYKKTSYRIAHAANGTITNGVANYGDKNLTPSGGSGTDKGADQQDGVDVPVTSGTPYTAPTQSWWTDTGFSGANWTTVWEWDTTTGLPKLR
jgi:hypothetical protein